MEQDLIKHSCQHNKQPYKAPAPTDSSVRIVRVEEFTAIVKRFGGYVMENSIWKGKAEEFK